MSARNAVVLLGLAALALGAGGARAAVAPAPAPRPRVKPWTPPAAAAPYLEAIGAAEAQYGLPPGMLLRQLDIESDHFADDVVYGQRLSSAGAIGIGQFMPATAEEYGVDPYDPASSIDGAARLMSDLYARFGDWTTALAAYNWGLGNVRRKGIGNLPRESLNYATRIIADAGVFG